jgi:type III pantothenate kinase
MLLVVDIGNTNTHLGLCLDGKVEKAWHMRTNPTANSGEVVSAIRAELPRGTDKRITAAAVASVVPQSDSMWWAVLQKTFRLHPVWVTAKLPLGIEIRYKPTKNVGADRIANAVGGFKKYGGPLIIIDFGTAVTLDVIDAKGNYIGGVIGPGIQLTMNALHAGTALLPKMKLKEALQDPDKVLGQDTVSAMRSGIVFGFCGMVREIVERLKEEQGFNENVAVIATGGNSEAITKRLPFVKVTDPNLTLDGLCEIHARVHGKIS